MKKIKQYLINTTIVLTIVGLVCSFPGFAEAKTHRKTKTTGGSLSDAAFTNTSAMGVTQIQNILSANGSFLRNYHEGGRSAAQIIRDAAIGHGDASGTMYGIKISHTVNPAVILATLQKEQSLVTMHTLNEGSLRAAMGYGCPDSGGCDDKYKGFTKQVENGAWQLRYNYERAKGHGFKDYQVGQTIKLDGKSVKIASRTMASLYRYTPHYSSNFATFFAQYNPATASSATTVSAVTTDYSGVNCVTLKSKALRRACKIYQVKNPGSAAASATTATTVSAVTTDYSGVNCVTLKSKALRRACKIYQVKNPGSAAASATTTNAATTSVTASTQNNLTKGATTTADCDRLFSSKSARRLCKWNLPK